MATTSFDYSNLSQDWSSSLLSSPPLSTTTTTTVTTTNNDDQEALSSSSSLRSMALQHCIMPLSSKNHKGSLGWVGILGGSAQYTGAPYYAAMASLKVGADLAFVFCANKAAIPIKSYSPELMVAPVYLASKFDQMVQMKKLKQEQQDNNSNNNSNDDDNYDEAKAKYLIQEMVHKVDKLLDKLHVLVIGPGLGRCPMVLEATSWIIQRAQSLNIPLVLDADALYMLTIQPYQEQILSVLGEQEEEGEQSSLSSLLPPMILTPNVMERKQLFQSFQSNKKNDTTTTTFSSWTFPKHCIIVEKGNQDCIQYYSQSRQNQQDQQQYSSTYLDCTKMGRLKRPGGLGDLLAGTLGTLVAWNAILEGNKKRNNKKQQQQLQQSSTTNNKDNVVVDDDDDDDDDYNYNYLPISCWTACCILKMATCCAFQEHRRSMTAPDVLHVLGNVINDMTWELDQHAK